MTYSKRIRLAPILVALAIALLIALAVSLVTPKPADAFIHEIIAAACRHNKLGEVEPPGQVPPRQHGKSEVRALLATGFIVSIDPNAGDGNDTQITFDPTVPASKFISAGFDLTIPGGAGGPGQDLILSPLVIPDPNFPGHVHCFNFPE